MTKHSIPAAESTVAKSSALYLEFTPSMREALEFLADAAIMLLDEIDRHTDELEDDDREESCEGEGDQCDDEGEPEQDACLGWREWTCRGEHVGDHDYALA